MKKILVVAVVGELLLISFFLGKIANLETQHQQNVRVLQCIPTLQCK